MIVVLRWLVSVILIGLSACIIVANLWIAFGGLFRKRDKFVSYVPLVGGLMGAAGLLLVPLESSVDFWWIPLVVDWGCGPLFIAVAIDQIKKKLFRAK